ncbi:SRPBCC family protein [Mycolicibacterium confluentis]|nr:SRPBCC family protein [Mycolicibacterium confluentis]
MSHASRSRSIPAKPQAIWDVLADFGAISAWADGVDHSCVLNARPDVLGTTRRIQMGRNTVVERITEFSPPDALAYAIEGLPRRMGALSNRWTLQAVGDGTHVTLTSSVDIGSGPVAALAERVIARVMAKQSDAMLNGLARAMGEAT